MYVIVRKHHVRCHFSFYNFKSLEKAVAPNVALTPLPLGNVGPMSPLVPSTSHPSGGEPPGEGANSNSTSNSRPHKRRATGELLPPAIEDPCPPSSAASKLLPPAPPPPPPPQDDKDSEVEIEVESRDECKQRAQCHQLDMCRLFVTGLDHTAKSSPGLPR